MIRPPIRNAALAILICVACFIVWFHLRTDGEVAVSENAPDAPALKETSELPPVPLWESESKTSSIESDRKPDDDEEFLATEYEPLDKWLSERFEIDYQHMTARLIFDQVPLNDIYYDTVALPEDAPEFRLRSPGISRRELLEKIADFWELDMSIATDESGTPTAVRVLSPGFYR